MQPITALSVIEIVFIIWFGAQMLIPVMMTTMTKENDHDNS